MERSKYFLKLVLLFLCNNSIRASYKLNISYISRNMDLKKKIYEMNMQKIKNNDFVLELLNYQSVYIAWCVGNYKDNVAKIYSNLGEQNIEILEKIASKASIINSDKSAFVSFKIGLNLLKTPFIKSQYLWVKNELYPRLLKKQK